MGNNICGAVSKQESLFSNIKRLDIGCFMLQETKLSNKGMIKIPGYVIFETISSSKQGGSLLTGVPENLEPVLIFEDENLEILVVQIKMRSMFIRIINAYGPQEYTSNER